MHMHKKKLGCMLKQSSQLLSDLTLISTGAVLVHAYSSSLVSKDVA